MSLSVSVSLSALVSFRHRPCRVRFTIPPSRKVFEMHCFIQFYFSFCMLCALVSFCGFVVLVSCHVTIFGPLVVFCHVDRKLMTPWSCRCYSCVKPIYLGFLYIGFLQFNGIVGVLCFLYS